MRMKGRIMGVILTIGDTNKKNFGSKPGRTMISGMTDMFSPAIMVVGDKKGREHIWWFDVVCQ
jgi:hypothetical protein